MKQALALLFGATVAMLFVSLMPTFRQDPPRKPRKDVVAPEPVITEVAPRPPPRPPVRKSTPEAQAHAAASIAVAKARPPSVRRFPSEETRLSSVYDYWQSQAPDTAMTEHETSRIHDMLVEHAVEPQSVEITCSAKICRSQMTFADIGAAIRLNALERRSDRRIYAAVDPTDTEFRVALYWTLTDEATREAPDPVRQPGDLPPEAEPAGAYEYEPPRPLDG